MAREARVLRPGRGCPVLVNRQRGHDWEQRSAGLPVLTGPHRTRERAGLNLHFPTYQYLSISAMSRIPGSSSNSNTGPLSDECSQ